MAAKRPSRKWYFLSAAMCIIAAALIGWGVWSFVDDLCDMAALQVRVPGSAQYQADEPMTLTIYHETGAVIDGRLATGSLPPDLKVTITDLATSQPVELAAPRMSETYNISGRRGRAIFSASLPHAGTYQIAATGTTGATDTSSRPRSATVQAAPVVLTAGKSVLGKVVTTFIVTLTGGILLGVSGFLLFLVVLLLRIFRRQSAESPSTASTGPYGQQYVDRRREV